jgi:hypothetical protein
MEAQMFSIYKTRRSGWTPIQYIVEWQGRIRSRNGTDDARRALRARLLVQQGGPPIGSFASETAQLLPLGASSPLVFDAKQVFGYLARHRSG